MKVILIILYINSMILAGPLGSKVVRQGVKVLQNGANSAYRAAKANPQRAKMMANGFVAGATTYSVLEKTINGKVSVPRAIVAGLNTAALAGSSSIVAAKLVGRSPILISVAKLPVEGVASAGYSTLIKNEAPTRKSIGTDVVAARIIEKGLKISKANLLSSGAGRLISSTVSEGMSKAALKGSFKKVLDKSEEKEK